MLIIEPKRNQIIKLHVAASDTVITVKTYQRPNGNIALGFDAPETVKITRIRQKAKDNENSN